VAKRKKPRGSADHKGREAIRAFLDGKCMKKKAGVVAKRVRKEGRKKGQV